MTTVMVVLQELLHKMRALQSNQTMQGRGTGPALAAQDPWQPPGCPATSATPKRETSKQRYERATQQMEYALHLGRDPLRVASHHLVKAWPVPGEAMDKAPKLRIVAPAWDGNREELEAYIEQCELHFDLNPTRFPTDNRRVVWALAHITGPPQEHLRNLRQARPNDALFHNWKRYCSNLRKAYRDPHLGHTARMQLQQLRQTGSVSKFAAKFQALATQANATDKQQLLTTFQLGLKETFCRSLLHVQTHDLQEYIEAAIQTEQQMFKTGLEPLSAAAGPPQTAAHFEPRDCPQGEAPANQPPLLARGPHQAPACAVVALQRLTEDTQCYRRKNNLCYTCGEKHLAPRPGSGASGGRTIFPAKFHASARLEF